jgi:hypothetical protein
MQANEEIWLTSFPHPIESFKRIPSIRRLIPERIDDSLEYLDFGAKMETLSA